MPTKMMPASGKPPLARSPIRLRPRRALHSSVTTIQTTPPPSQPQPQPPPGSLMKTKLSRSACIDNVVEEEEEEETGIRPEYRTISCELRALAKMVSQEFGEGGLGNISTANGSNSNRSPLFERGRFYEEYSARRNERLKRKKTGDEKKPTVYDLGVRVESAKRRDTKKFESLRRTMPCTPLTEKREAPSSRYSLRSAACKENKKPPVPISIEQSAGVGTKKTGVRRARKN